MIWRLLMLSLPTENTVARMRAWRTLKAAGAAVLRDAITDDDPLLRAAAGVFEGLLVAFQKESAA